MHDNEYTLSTLLPNSSDLGRTAEDWLCMSRGTSSGSGPELGLESCHERELDFQLILEVFQSESWTLLTSLASNCEIASGALRGRMVEFVAVRNRSTYVMARAATAQTN